MSSVRGGKKENTVGSVKHHKGHGREMPPSSKCNAFLGREGFEIREMKKGTPTRSKDVRLEEAKRGGRGVLFLLKS